jgi:hypothetical protein
VRECGKIVAVRAVLLDRTFEPGARMAKEDSMSDEQRKDEETEVEGHLVPKGLVPKGLVPKGLVPKGVEGEPTDDDEFEAHLLRNIRMD